MSLMLPRLDSSTFKAMCRWAPADLSRVCVTAHLRRVEHHLHLLVSAEVNDTVEGLAARDADKQRFVEERLNGKYSKTGLMMIVFWSIFELANG